MKLSDLNTGERGVIVKVAGHGGFRKRIVEMGFVKGKTVKVILNAPLRDPIEYEIMGYKISLRREEAKLIEVISESEAQNDARLHPEENLKGIVAGEDENEELQMQLDNRMKRLAADKRRIINVALVGNPNCGKTSLFNVASGGHEHVGNYSGVTVDAKEGFLDMKVKVKRNDKGEIEIYHQSPTSTCGTNCEACGISSGCTQGDVDGFEDKVYHFRIVDLPGTYSLSAYSPEELYVRRHLIDETPDIVINVVDSSNLERNLYLTTQLIDMHQRMVVALNMFDELQHNGDKLDYVQLGHLLGVPMIPTISRTGKGIRDLFETVVAVYENQYDTQLERHIHVNHGKELEQSIDRLKIIFQKNQNLRSKYSTRYLAIKFLEGDSEAQHLVETLPQHDELVAVRYEETQRLKADLHDTPDNAITDAKYGFVQGALKETYQPHVARQGRTLTEKIDAFVTNRYWGFPLFFVVLFLIFFITFQLGAYPMDWIDWIVGQISDFVKYAMPDGILKDMIVDGAISGVGAVIVFLPNIMILYLFISLLEDSGYMARAAFIMDKLMHHMGLHGKSFIPMVMGFGCNVPAIMATRTIENPKSRLITMLITPFMSCSAKLPIYAFFTSVFFPGKGALVMIFLYVFGILTGIIFALILKGSLFKGEPVPFVMELPNYRMPGAKNVCQLLWEKAKDFLQRAFTVIFVATIVIWFLQTFDLRFNIVTESKDSILAILAGYIAPIFNPLGFGDWRISTALISGFMAKESVVSTLSILYGSTQSLLMSLTTPSALSLLIFCLLYTPCIAAIAAIKRELNGKWALIVVFGQCLIAWLASFVVYHLILLVF